MEQEQKLIAVIDDDVHIGNMLEELLVREGFAVLRAYSGTEALLLLSGRRRPDLVLLDLMLPGLSGEEVLPHLAGIPVIVLSARAGVDDKVELLLGGAADYLTKPFDTRELLARIAVQLRGAAPAAPALRCRGLVLDTAARAVSAGGEAVVTKSQLLDQISLDTPDCVESSLKVHVSNLRKKLRDAGAGDVIESVWGIGFKLTE